jgi:hypothetical protein
MMQEKSLRLIPIYTTQGDVGAFLAYPNLFNRDGEWIGWVTAQREVYSVHGHYAGILNDDPRILRKLSEGIGSPRMDPPPFPGQITLPATIPLAPFMPELPIGFMDVLQDAPELLPSIDFGELREDMD